METRYPHALKLGIFLVAEHFGPTCRQVCSLLLERGRLSYDEIVAALVKNNDHCKSGSATGFRGSYGNKNSVGKAGLLPRKMLYDTAAAPWEGGPDISMEEHELCKALIVLSQQGLLQSVFLPPHARGQTRDWRTVYTLNLRNVILRLRIASFAEAVSRELEGHEEDLEKKGIPHAVKYTLLVLISHGTITKDRFLKECLELCMADAFDQEEDEEGEGNDPSVFQNEISALLLRFFRVLVELHVMIPANRTEPSKQEDDKSAEQVGKGRGTSKRLPSRVDTEKESAKRTKLRKGEYVTGGSDPSLIWYTANYARLHRLMLNHHIEDYLAAELGSDVAKVYKYMLRAAGEHEEEIGRQYCRISSIINQSDVIAVSRSLWNPDEQDRLSPAEYNEAYTVLQKSPLNLVTDSGERWGSGIRLTTEAVLQRIKRSIAESYVLERYGERSVRIFRLLLDKGQLNQKLISDMALLPMKSVRTVLYKMMTDDMVKLQDVPKRADRNPQNTLYMWSVDLDAAYYAISESVYKSLFNLLLRKQRGLTRNEDLLKRVESVGHDYELFDPENVDLSMQVCREASHTSAHVFLPGKIINVDKDTREVTVKWQHKRDCPVETVSFEDPLLMARSQITFEDNTSYLAMVIAKQKIDHTAIKLDEHLAILQEAMINPKVSLAPELTPDDAEMED